MKNANPQKSIVGIGSALVDVLVQLKDDQLLEQFGLPKGSMTLVDAALSKQILEASAGLESGMETGGSSANTVRGIAQLGGKTGFIGKVHDDKMGQFFKKTFEDLQIKPHLFHGSIPSGVAATLISPDSERTFGTYLGAASELSVENLSDELFAPYNYLHIEGYLVFNHELIEGILKIAKRNGLTISLDMASFNVVEANLEFLKRLVHEYVDIVFANEEEAKAYTRKEPEEALKEIATQCSIAIVKIGKEGSLVQAGDEFVRVDAFPVNAVDTTGAGDVYASGFLYGLANGLSLENCGKLGGILAAEVIQVLGAKIPDESWPQIMIALEKMKA
ncbi:adenosine kinase [Mangrovibacterium lignilyticum]|uniref:adenosine kinase n=1 Tax=Mangrovibacterium lignilyticum TaxID=2668052 RepID=UPI0013D21292|nr:adenosine kinase [Mangrovibacterium lignilyticum]